MTRSLRAFEREFMAPRDRALGVALADLDAFSDLVLEKRLRPYQLEVGRAVLNSVDRGLGLTFTCTMARQAGKNEMCAQVQTFLLLNHKSTGGSMVMAAPTYFPQLSTSIQRLYGCLNRPLTHAFASLHFNTIRLGEATITFLSGQPHANVMGATASLLLVIDEAQNFDEDKFYRDFFPMVAATNATILLVGTAWTDNSLLQNLRLENRRLEAEDGIRRDFVYPWAVVAQHVPSYRIHVFRARSHMGAEHPHFRSQYECQTLSQNGRTFSETQIAQMQLSASQRPMPLRPDELPPRDPQSHPLRVEEASALPAPHQPTDTRELTLSPRGGELERGAVPPVFIAGIDLSGEAEEAEDAELRARQPRRDSTAVVIARVVWHREAGLEESHLQVVHLYWWTGRKHRDLLPQLIDLLKNVWRCQSVVVDATGVGAGISSLLFGALGGDVVHPFSFSTVSKSDLGYELISSVSAGRLKIPTDPRDLEGSSVPLLSQRERLGEGTQGPTPSPRGGGLGRGASLSQPENQAPGGSGGALPPDSIETPLRELWNQLRLAQSSFQANQRLAMFVDPREGHDDLLIATALAVHAAQHSRPRVARGRLVRR